MDKKYQIFVSSTFEDLIEERQEVFKTLIDLEHIPVGMESFPAIDMEQFEYIKRMIDACDYYILIIAGRYGSTAQDGISYTEKEYEYALSKNIPILTFTHINYKELPSNKVENTDDGKKKLDIFIERTSGSKLKKDYDNKDNLVKEIAISLPKTIRLFPAIGWVRADQVANSEVLADINTLRKENDALKEKLLEYENSDVKIDNLADFDDVFEFEVSVNGFKRKHIKTWREIFSTIATQLRNQEHLYHIGEAVENYFIKLSPHCRETNSNKIEFINFNLNKIMVHFENHNLLLFNNGGYYLTKKGKQVMLQSLAVKKDEMVES